MKPSVVIVTFIPSPYQVELFDRLAADGRLDPSVVYMRAFSDDRNWKASSPQHRCVIAATAEQEASQWVVQADLVVFSNYSFPVARQWMRTRVASKRPWVLWGERPGFSRLPLVSRLSRRWRLAPLVASHAPIWGMGGWAVEGWRAEFGKKREYQNLPYFSNLLRFQPPADSPSKVGDPDSRRLLFSGSQIPRKGVDLLAEAYATVASECPRLHLGLVGTGPLEGNLRSQLAQFGDRVRFSGFVDWELLPAAYHQADILVAPSRYDGWGLIVAEGLAAGLPVIGTDRTGAALDLLRHGVNGWVTRAGNLNSLIAALREAAHLSPERLAKMRSEAIRSVSCHQLADGARRFAEAAESAIQNWSRKGRL